MGAVILSFHHSCVIDGEESDDIDEEAFVPGVELEDGDFCDDDDDDDDDFNEDGVLEVDETQEDGV